MILRKSNDLCSRTLDHFILQLQYSRESELLSIAVCRIATQSRNLGTAPGLLAHDTKILPGGLEPFHQTI